MKPFIRIGDITINRTDIIKIYHDITTDEYLHCVRVVTRELTLEGYGDISAASQHVSHDYEHGTPEAAAILIWLESQTEDLLAEEPYEVMIPVDE